MENKKILLAMAALILCACQAEEAQSADTAPETPHAEETPVQEEETAETKTEVSFWIKEPSMRLDDAADLEAVPFILGAEIEYEGSPNQWYKASQEEQKAIRPYREDVILASYEGKYGIMDYDGNVVFPFVIEDENKEDDAPPVVYQPYSGFLSWYGLAGARVFNEDFTKRTYAMSGGLGGYAPMPYVKDHQVMIDDLQTLEPSAYTNTWNRRIAAQIRDDEGNSAGCAVISPDTRILFETAGHCGTLANGFLSVNENAQWDNPGRQGFIRVSDGKDITGGTVYDEVQPFVNGIAPVRKGDRWAFIDEDGSPVSEFLFDDASCVYEGRAYVSYEGLYGILDVAAAADQGILISAETIGSGYQERAMDMPGNPDDDPLGSVKVLVSNLNSRSIPSASGEKKGKVEEGAEYDVYDIFENEGYTWYRIGEYRWIADGGEWLQYSAG